MSTVSLLGCAAALAGLLSTTVEAGPRLDAIRKRGVVTCGVEPIVTGFATVDAKGHYSGLDVDICRALSAAIFGTPDKVDFVTVLTLSDFQGRPEVDVVNRRLTWELRREAPLGLQFGPVTFHDGQGFLVPGKLGAQRPGQLAGVDLCVARGSVFESNAVFYFDTHKLAFKKVFVETALAFDDIAKALAEGRCAAYTADVSELGAIRSRLPQPGAYDILAERISREPLAPLVRQDDPQFFAILRWTIFALINAEELGVTSTNADRLRQTSQDRDVQRLLGVVPGNGAALGLSEAWAYNAIRSLGNYGEIFERNVGRDSAVKLERGLNRLWTSGGLMYAPPLR
jgi:general L-amino acid transport system substrate-binding protein